MIEELMMGRYIKRKREQETSTAAAKAAKVVKAKAEQNDREMVFGDVIKTERKPLSPKVTIAMDRKVKREDGVLMENSGMGVKDEATGMIVGGKGLKEVGKEMINEEDDE